MRSSTLVGSRIGTNADMRGRTSFVLLGCERSDQYRSRKKDFVRRDTGSKKCGCAFKLLGNQWLEARMNGKINVWES